jgi:hypothetical protein
MDKAESGNSTEGWILLSEARQLVAKAVQATGLAERLLVERLHAGSVRWSCWRAEGGRRPGDPPFRIGEPAYWEVSSTTGQQRIQLLDIDWDESAAAPLLCHEFQYSVYRVTVPLADVEDLIGALGLELGPKAEPAPPASTPVVDRLVEVLLSLPQDVLAEVLSRPRPSYKNIRTLIEPGWKKHEDWGDLPSRDDSIRRALLRLREGQ